MSRQEVVQMRRTISKILVSGSLIFLLSPGFLASAGRPPEAVDRRKADEEVAIRQVIRNYFDAMKNIDADKLRSSVHEGAKIFSRQGGEVAEVSGKELYESRKRGQRPERPLPYAERILRVDINGSVAVAKVEMVLPNARLSGGAFKLSGPTPQVVHDSYLSLMKFQEGWRIVGVVTSISERAAPSPED